MYGVNDLQSIKDPEDVSTPVLKMCPKVPVECEATPVNYLKSDQVEEYRTIETKDFFNPDLLASFSVDENETKSQTSRSGRSRGAGSARGSLPGVTPRSGRPASREVLRSREKGSQQNSRPTEPQEGGGGGPATGLTQDNLNSLPVVAVVGPGGGLDAASSVSWGHGESKELPAMGHTANSNLNVLGGLGTKKKKKREVRRENPEERFDKLVGLIKASKGADMNVTARSSEKDAKKGKKAPPPPSPLIGSVVDSWCAISRF